LDYNRLVPRNALEVADIFRAHGPTWREHRRGHRWGHLSLGQLNVMSAIEQCRSLALGGRDRLLSGRRFLRQSPIHLEGA